MLRSPPHQLNPHRPPPDLRADDLISGCVDLFRHGEGAVASQKDEIMLKGSYYGWLQRYIDIALEDYDA